jgi:Protein tyrosine and serine/threonine kinase
VWQVVRLVKDGNVMLKPENCPDILYDMMKDCWQRNPEQRPSFLDICERLLPHATELFIQTAFYTSSQGAEAVATQAALRQAQEEADLATPLTTNGKTALVKLVCSSGTFA